MKRLFIFLFTLCFMSAGYGITTADIDGVYTAVIASDVNNMTVVNQFNVELESTGIYYVYENRNVGGKDWQYPVIIDTFYIDAGENIILNVAGDKVSMKYVGGNLVGFLGGSGISVVFTRNNIFNPPCAYEITQLDVTSFVLSTNKSSCYFSPGVSNATVKSLEYIVTGDAILTLDLTSTDVNDIVEITVGNQNFSYVPKPVL